MLEGKGIALIMFTALNGLGVVFLLYVLVQFWKEGQMSKRARRQGSQHSMHRGLPRDFVVNASLAAQTRRQNGRLIPFPVRGPSGQQCGDEAMKHAVR
jgi:hypothetical protein